MEKLEFPKGLHYLKKELADAVISGDAGQFTSMSKEDIAKLLM